MSPSNNDPLASSPEQPQQGVAQQSGGAAVPRVAPIQSDSPVQEPAAAQSDAASVVPATATTADTVVAPVTAPVADAATMRATAPAPATAPANATAATVAFVSAPSNGVNTEHAQGESGKDAPERDVSSVEQGDDQPTVETDESDAQQPSAADRPHVSAKNTVRVSASDQIPDPIKKAKRKRLIKRVVIALAALLVAAAIGVAAFSIWTIWYRFDDAADIQGTWVNSEGVSVTFDASQMHLQSGVSFNYTINPETKEIDYSFSRSSGHGVYRFAQDRSILIIDEKGKTDWLLILEAKEDPALQGTLPEGVTVFRRAS